MRLSTHVRSNVAVAVLPNERINLWHLATLPKRVCLFFQPLPCVSGLMLLFVFHFLFLPEGRKVAGLAQYSTYCGTLFKPCLAPCWPTHLQTSRWKTDSRWPSPSVSSKLEYTYFHVKTSKHDIVCTSKQATKLLSPLLKLQEGIFSSVYSQRIVYLFIYFFAQCLDMLFRHNPPTASILPQVFRTVVEGCTALFYLKGIPPVLHMRGSLPVVRCTIQ